jgi:hypothetical protein
MTKPQQLHDLHGLSPWLDDLTRGDLTGGRLLALLRASGDGASVA